MEPKQKEALFSLAGIVWMAGVTVAILCLLGSLPAWVLWVDLVAVIMITPVVIYGAWLRRTGQFRGEDERDRAIMSKVYRWQNWATLLAICACTVVYPNAYIDRDQVPKSVVIMALASVLGVNVLAGTAGTLVAYWLAGRSGTKP